MDIQQKLIKSTRTIKNNVINPAEQLKFKQHIQKRTKMIEKLFQKSLPNQIYTFPKLSSCNQTIISSDSSDQDIPEIYELKSQNQKNKNYQANFHQSNTNRTTGLRNKIISYHSVKSINPAKSTDDKFETQYHSKKRTKEKTTEKNKYKSQRSILHISSIGKNEKRNRQSIESNQTKPIVITFRGTKKRDITVSLTRKRIRTELF